MGILLWVDLYNRPPFYSGDLKSQLSGFSLATVGAGLGGMVLTGMLVGNAHPTVEAVMHLNWVLVASKMLQGLRHY
ncbi:hypothetical protein [Coleofasciculus sp.]|uniref:hypothetical protein n=1 Tax=Coleofasciculus sp. TaxID=3100458 RepID=UPI003A2E327B